ncbi:MAG TPA: ATP-binding protein [Rhodocyclaceae bacterium]|nr:ATP-binding protein [Rhodocyclaceae bacterium]
MFTRPRSLARRIYFAFLIAAVLPTAVAGVLGVYFSLQTLKTETLNNLEQEVTIRAQGVGRFLGQLAAELRYLAASPTLDRLRRATTSGIAATTSAREELEREYLSLASLYPHIYQIRFLSDDGREQVRVDRIGNLPHAVPIETLQNKSDRYYFRDALRLQPGAIYVSPLDLNVEFGRIEEPERPVIRMATRLADGNAPGGMLIVNLHADILLEQIQQMADVRKGVAILFDRSGYYLSHGREKEGEGFEMRPVATLEQLFGDELVGRLLKGEQIVEGNGWIFAARAIPDFAGESVETGRWVLALAFPQHGLMARVFNLTALYAVLLSALAVTALAGFFLSRRLLGPIDVLAHESEALAGGDFSRRVDIPGNDEIAALGQRFNDMARRLRSLYVSLEGQRDHLEQQVQARTADLERERNLLERLFLQLGDAVVQLAPDGKVRLSNPAAAALLGVVASGSGALDEQWPDWEQLRHAFNEDPVNRHEVEHRGRILSVSVSASPEGQLIVARDVTQERRFADHQREIDRQMFQMEKMVTLGELAMGLAHEIGNPLAGMKAVAQAMQYEEDVPPGLLEALRRLEREIDRLSGFLKSFHGYTAPQSLRLAPCSLAAVVDDVLFWIRKEARLQGARIDTELPADLPALLADENALKQVLLNLLVNALHALGEDGWIRISARAANAGVLIEIADNGRGIPPGIQARIFDAFYTTRTEGTGLGLAIVRKIVQQHGATITLTRSGSDGTQFALQWPSAAGTTATTGTS